MERLEMKQLKKTLAGICLPLKRIDNGHYDFCRLYEVSLPDGETHAVLKVFDHSKIKPSMLTEDNNVWEIKYYSKLQSSVFPTILSYGTIGKGKRRVSYLITELLTNNRTLTEAIALRGPLKMGEPAVAVILELANALKELQGLMQNGGHNNVCTDNVLVCKGRAYLTGTTLVGEEDNKPDTCKTQSDVYAFSQVLCFLLTGVCPTEASADLKIGNEELKTIILTGLSNDSHKRYASMAQMFDALCRALKVTIKTKDEIQESQMHEQDGAVAVSSAVVFKKQQGNGFAEVAGMELLKQTLTRDFVKVLRNLELAQIYGISPYNVILFGPPGCGKTFIAHKLAEECGIAFSYVRPSDLGSTYIHGTQEKIDDLFNRAAQQAPCLLCIDEIDALLPQRNVSPFGQQNDEVAEWLTQLNDCSKRGVYVMAMTNRICAIDEAAIRKGRFDAVIYVPLPDKMEREQIFRMKLHKCPCSANIDVKELARQTDGYTSSDLVAIVQEAARCAFEQTLASGSTSPLPIDRKMLLEVISHTHPSVSSQSLQQYERERQRFEKNSREERIRIGFR